MGVFGYKFVARHDVLWVLYLYRSLVVSSRLVSCVIVESALGTMRVVVNVPFFARMTVRQATPPVPYMTCI